ncbi:hypothetical protein JR316_0008164 [Psilocybe cubensis]|uniref:Uncharacterized protein n=2 Tax=Psilocybe cubensis TaxID=181762 RepID=A0ACB8GX28_PSICU|nr:hypothetical protein JR316_0008164 [Psilocybe cubensis]KAH9479569.1 hypothetical protein JR316_0008164 [Psilocybe cubensis]
MGYWGRGPSRLLWFAIGAASATWWVRRRECSNRSFGPCIRQPIQSPIGNTDTTQPSWPQSVTDIPRAINNIPQPAPVQHTTYSPSTIGEWEKRQDAQWELEKEHLAKISRQATDAMAELTEATLESVLATAESLKAKLAEHRAQREKQQKQIEEEMERQRRDPPRLV